MVNDSFQFGKYNSLTDLGIRCVGYDFLFPPKRERKIVIPNRDGAYDFGARNYGERVLRVWCLWLRNKEEIPMHKIREISYALSDKNRISFYNEPDKYYVGELFAPSELQRYYQEKIVEFELEFICEPFAYGKEVVKPLILGENTLNYEGTANTPTIIRIKNNGETDLKNLVLTVKRRY